MPRAGLGQASVTKAGAQLADEIGVAQISMSQLAERLGVKTPSLYKHVASQADLVRRIAILALTELSDTIREATQGRAGRDALSAAAWAIRTYVIEHPGRFAAANSARADGIEGDLLVAARDRALGSIAAVLHGYRLDAEDETHALRMLRSMLYGFATIEGAGGFQFDTNVDDSFNWMIDFIDRGLQATPASAQSELPTP